MNIGNIATQALMRSGLSVTDYPMREVAYQMLDEIIQFYAELRKWQFLKSNFYISTADGIEEYALSKYCSGVQGIIPNTMRGSNPVRRIDYEPAHEFKRKRSFSLDSGDPYFYREGEFRGFETQVSAASTISISSSFSNITTGNVTTVQGSRRFVFSSAVLTIDCLGRWIRVFTDTKRYRIVKIFSTTVCEINEEYEEASNTYTYAMGDVQQKVVVQGLDTNGVIIEEEVELNGSTAVTTQNTFAQVMRISKSDKTQGYITAKSNGNIITNVILDPGETEADFQTVLLYPIPTKIELISFEGQMRHPHLYRATDSPLFPNQYHPLLVAELYIKLQEEWNEKEVPANTLSKRDEMKQQMIDFDNDTSNWKIQQETEGDSERSKMSNMPESYGANDGILY